MNENRNESVGRVLRRLQSELPRRTHANYEMAKLTSFRLGGAAAAFVLAESEFDLEIVAGILTSEPTPALVLGRGTNLLVSDRGFDGVVVQLGKGFDWLRDEGGIIEAGGMTPLPQVANRAARLGMEGMEFAIAIPATVGGAVRMNAGAHGSSISDVLRSTIVFRLFDGGRSAMSPQDLRMAYRQTLLGPTDVVCSAEFQLQPGDKEEIASKMDSYREHRAVTQPVDAPNAGSMFRNPVDDSAGRLIEAAGLKGHTVGLAEVSTKHANFFLAHPGATAQNVFDLMAHIQQDVESRFGILLIPEVHTVGPFDRAGDLRRE